MTQHAFQTEVTQLLHLMIHSLYSEREIFLRELLANASDACDKLRFQALTNPGLLAGGDELRIDVQADEQAKTITFIDNGVGLTEAEAIEHLGTIAKSGTKAFMQSLGQDKAKDATLIGQFGVGFYSAFMVADKVVVESRSAHAGADAGVRWESAGDGNFTTESVARAARGTTVTLHLKEDATEFAAGWRLRELVKKWSDYLAYPIRLPKHQTEEEAKKGPPELEQANAGQPLWTKPKDQVTDEQYAAFYKSACRMWDEPATRLHVTVEGTLSFTTLLFVPTQKPYDMFERERRGVSLYVRRVFIMDDCKDLLPDWLRFLRGIVDSDDLPLNVSREILQNTTVVPKIRKQLVKKVIDHLLTLAASSEEKDQAAWTAIDTTFGPIIREGLVTDPEHQERVARLARYRSTWTEAEAKGPTSLEDYVRRMPAGQEAIYVVTAASPEAAAKAPQIEGFRKKGFEVLFLTDPVDEYVVQHLTTFDGKKLAHVAKGGADLASADEKKDLEEQAKTFGGFMGFAKEALGDDIREVRLTSRLTDSPCCLVADEHGVSTQMEEIMKRMGQPVPKQQRVLELNPTHPLVLKLQSMHGQDASSPKLKDHLSVLRDQAVLADGGRLADPAGFAKKVQELLLVG